jgi:hypothetical protein
MGVSECKGTTDMGYLWMVRMEPAPAGTGGFAWWTMVRKPWNRGDGAGESIGKVTA